MALLFSQLDQFTDNNTGAPVAAGTVTVYQNETTTPQAIYSDPDLTVAVGTDSVLTLDTAGRLGVNVYISDSAKVTILVRTSSGAQVENLDNAWGINLDNRVSVKKFGAKGDGVTDDTVAIQSALTYCATLAEAELLFNAGEYLVSSSLSIPTRVWIRGEGLSTQITVADGMNDHVFTAASIPNFGIQKLTIDGNSANQTAGNLINITGCSRFFLKDLYLNDAYGTALLAGDVAETTGCSDFTINNIDINTTTTSHGMSIDRGARGAVSDIRIRDPHEAGLQIFLSDRLAVNNIIVQQTLSISEGFGGIRITSTTEDGLYNTVSNFTISGMSRGLFVGENTNFCTFANGVIRNCDRDGIYCESSQDNLFSNISIQEVSLETSNTWSGVSLVNSVRNNFHNIQFRNTGSTMAYNVNESGTSTENSFFSSRLVPAQTDWVTTVDPDTKFEGCIYPAGSETIASAGTLSIPPVGRFFNVTGTTTINDITDHWVGRDIILKFNDSITITDGSGIELAAGSNLSAVNGDLLHLISDGTTWYEVDH